MKRQLSCIILTFALLVSMLSVGFVLPAAAEVTATTITASDNVVIAPEDNILKGATCSESAFTQSQLYDGLVKNDTVNVWDQTSGNNSPNIETVDGNLWVTYTLPTPTAVESVLIAGSTATRDGGLGFDGFAVYIGDKDADAIKADGTVAPVYENTDRVYNGEWITFNQPLMGTRIVFRIRTHQDEKWKGKIWLSEVAATGEALYTVITEANAASPIAEGDNLLATYAAVSESQYCKDTKLFDGVINASNHVQALPNHVKPSTDVVDGYMWVTYTLSSHANIDELLISGGGKAGNGNPLGFDGVDVYVGTMDHTAILADATIEPTFSYHDFMYSTLHVKLQNTVFGNKVVFKIGFVGTLTQQHYSNQIRLSELAVAGEVVYTETVITEANAASPIAVGDNLLASYSSVSETQYCKRDTAAFLYDGIINAPKSHMDAQTKWMKDAVDGYMWITYTLPSYVSVDELVISGPCYTGTSGPLGFDGVDVYVGTMDHDTIIATDSAEPIYSYHAFMRETLHVELAEAVVGNTIVFKFGIMGTLKTDSYKDRVRLSELAVGGRSSVLTTEGAQVRATATDGSTALRFGFDLFADGVNYADDTSYVRDLQDAAYIVDGKTCAVVDFGAVVSKDAESDLMLESVNGTDTQRVPANNLYAVNGSVTTFTAVVVRIPVNQRGTLLYARPYVTYDNGEEEITVYGNSFAARVSDYLTDET